MKTHSKVLTEIRDGRVSRCLDGRDYGRLINFYPIGDWALFGYVLNDQAMPRDHPRPWTESEILKQLESDLVFAFEKALDKRGLSADMMNEVVKMWLWILEDELAAWPDSQYPQHGLPLLKAVALKYGWPNPIGDDTGTEDHYVG